MNRTKLYRLLLLLCIAGYAWLLLHFFTGDELAGGCLFKHLTHLPCPSCGSTRSVFALLQGEVISSLYWNPIGWVLLSLMIVVPLWLGYDSVSKRDTLYVFYRKAEHLLKQKYVAIPLVLLLLANWIWNIAKGV